MSLTSVDDSRMARRARVNIFESVMRPSTEDVLARSGIFPGCRVADIGCGRGDVSIMLSKVVGRDGVVYAVDLDEEKLADLALEAEALDVRNIVPMNGRIEEALPMLVPLDGIYSRFVLMHSTEPVRMIKQCVDCLSPSGVLILEEPVISLSYAGSLKGPWHRAVACYQQLCSLDNIDPDYGSKLCGDVASSGLHIRYARVVQEHISADLSNQYVVEAMRAHREAYVSKGILSEAEHCSIISEAGSLAESGVQAFAFHGVMQVVASKVPGHA